MTMSLLVEYFEDLLATPEDVEKLNQTILNLAVFGKLTRREQGDDSTSELLKQIYQEKQEDFPEIENSEITFEIPKEWKYIRLGELAKFIDYRGHTPKKTEGGMRLITAKNVRMGRLNVDPREYVDPEVYDKWMTRGIPRKGDLLFTTEAPMGNVCMLDTDEKVLFAQRLITFRLHGNVNSKFAMFALMSDQLQKQILDKSSGVTARGIKAKLLKTILLPLPSLAEQERIATRVEELYAQTRVLAKELAHSQIELDGLNQSALSHLLASETPEEFNQHWAFIAEHFDLLFQAPEHIAPLRQSILELAVRGKLTRREAGDESAKKLLQRIQEEKEKLGKAASLRQVKEEEKPFDLPQGWEWTRWDDVSLQIGDIDHKMPDEIPDGIPYISPRDFTGKEDISFATAKKISRKDYDDLAEKIKPERGDIIFPRYGTIGVNRFVSVDFEFLASYSCCIIKHMKGLMNPRYIFFYSISPFLQQETQKYVNKTTQANVGIKSIQKFLFPLPPLAEQERIVKRVEQLLSLCDALEARLQSAEEERGRLVRAVMAGVGG